MEPSHVVRAGEVAIWRDACLRGTGFAADLLLRTAAERSVLLIDGALAEERRGGRPWTASRVVLEQAFTEDWRRQGEVLREIARSPRFREAVTWQNRGAIHGGIAGLLRRPAGAVDSKSREYERLVASYLQRYCAKNDTIGFFGPVGWATFDEQIATSRIVPGLALLDRRTVYFEHWAIDALAARLSSDRELRAAIAPRKMPTIWLEGDLLHYPVDRVSRQPAVAVRLIEACDGVRAARVIAEQLVADPALELENVDEVYDLLDELVEANIVLWRLEVPTAGFRPELALRAAIDAAEPCPARDAAVATLVELCAARDRVAAAAGDPDALDGALEALGEGFMRFSGVAATRGAGKTYAGRGIVFEDCRRNVEVVLGRAFLDRIGAPLAMIQASARWFAYTAATRFRDVFTERYHALAAETGTAEVDFIRYYVDLRPHLTSRAGSISPTMRALRDELQQRWASLLALPPGVRHVELRADELAPRVQAAFAAPALGWPSARHHSPDLLLAAAGPDAVMRGDFLVVLGEVHAGVNAVTVPTLAKEHSDPERLHEARRADIGPTVTRVEPRASVHRAMTYTLAAQDIDVELGDTRSHRPRAQVFDIAGFVVIERAGQLKVRRRDGSFELDLVEFLESDLVAESYIFDMFEASAYRPRITVDQFVLARERWRLPAAELSFAKLATPFERFVGARRWAAELGVPRFVFAKTPGEPKPMYVDLDSPVFVEILAKLARSDDTISITEMLPTFDQLWLVDGEGTRYCGELRMVMVDDAVWTAPAT